MHSNLTVGFPNIVLAFSNFVLMGTRAKFSTGMITKRKGFWFQRRVTFYGRITKKEGEEVIDFLHI